MKKQSFVQGSVLLAGSALFAKVCGALFKLPLTALLGGTGMGYFSCAYGLFLPIYAVFVTGLSTAVARPTADFVGTGKFACALKVRKTARILCLFLGVGGMLAGLVCAKFFTEKTAGSPEAYPAVTAIMPAVLFCCLTAVERGYYEGFCNMTPTAVSQATEAVFKLLAGYGLGLFCFHHELYFLSGFSPASRGAWGAVTGVTCSTVLSWIYLMIYQFVTAKKQQKSSETVPETKKILKLLLKIMIPVSLGALVTNFTSFMDLFTMMRSFSKMLEENPENFYQKSNLAGEIAPEEASAFVYGAFMGLSVTVFNLVPSLTNMLAKSVLPCTAQAWSAGNLSKAVNYARQVFVLTGLLAIPAGCGIFALSEGILTFLFAGQEAEIQTAVSGLRWLAPGLIALCLAFPAFSLLQAVGREDLPVKLMIPAIILKFICNLILIPKFCTAGASISTSLCYGLLFILSLYFLRKELQQSLQIVKPLLTEFWGGVLCAGTAYLCYDWLQLSISQKLAFLLSVAVAVIVYILFLCLTFQGFPYQKAFRTKF